MLNSNQPETLGGSRSSDDSSAPGPKISIVVVTAERLFRHGLARLLSEDDRLEVIGVSDGDPQLLELCTSASVDVVLIDLELSQADGIDLVRLLASECPRTKSLALTSHADWRVRPTMIAGAAGVLLKNSSPEAIRAAVVSVHLDGQVLCREAAQWILAEEPSTHLTKRESDVLRMVAHGANNAEIASQLHLGAKTVRNYVSRLYRKLDLTNRAQIATYAARMEIAPSDSPTEAAFVGHDPSVRGQ